MEKQHSVGYRLVPLVFLITLLCLYFQASPLLSDPDVPWHIAAGELIFQTQQLPSTNTWSFAAQGTPWYLLSWIWNIILSSAYALGGEFGVYIFSIVTSATLIALIGWRLTALGHLPQNIIPVILLAALSIFEFSTARPQLGGYILLLLFHAVLHHSREIKTLRSMIWLPILMLIWVNIHGSFIIAFTMFAAYGIEALIKRDFVWLKSLVFAGAACLIAACINPYGPSVTLGALRSLDSVLRYHIMEWHPFMMNTSVGMSAIVIAFLLISNLRVKSASLADKILAASWLVAALTSMRHFPPFVILAAPYLAACFDEQTRGLREERPASALERFVARQRLSHIWAVCLFVSIVFIGIMSTQPHEDRIRSAEKTPDAAIDYAIEHYSGYHFLNDYGYGGEIIHRSQGKLKVFLDSRAGTAYTEKQIQDYLDLITLKKDWEDIAIRYRVNGIITSNESPFSKAYDRGEYHTRWKQVFSNDNVRLYTLIH